MQVFESFNDCLVKEEKESAGVNDTKQAEVKLQEVKSAKQLPAYLKVGLLLSLMVVLYVSSCSTMHKWMV